MDVNGAHFHLVLGSDWEDTIESPVDLDVCFDEQRNTIGLRPRPFVFPTRAGAARLTPEDRRGAAIDRFGNHYWIAPDRHSILALGAGASEAFEWWRSAAVPRPAGAGAAPAGHFEACTIGLPDELTLSGLAVTEQHVLVVGVLALPGADGASAGLLAFDLAGGGPPVASRFPAALGVRPFDLSSRPGGGVVVLDAPDPVDARPSRLWHLDRWLRVVDLTRAAGITPAAVVSVTAAFAPTVAASIVEPATVAAGAVAVSEARAEHAAELDVAWPVAVETLADGTVLVLGHWDADGHFDVSRWDCGQRLEFGLRLDEPVDPEAAFVCTEQRANARQVLTGVAGHDFAAVASDDGSGTPRLFVVGDGGDQAFELVIDLSGSSPGADLVTAYHPLRLYSGKALVRHATTVFYDLDRRWYPVPTQPIERFATDAVIVLAPDLGGRRGFDGGAPGTVWHRLVADAAIPPGTSVTVETRAADELSVLDTQQWLPEPAPYRRGDGSEIPYHQYRCGDATAGVGSWELLFQRAVGRYLQIRLTLHGDGRRTPRLWALRAHYPRFSYLSEYLPDIYREDRQSASFLDRYLSNVEGIYTTLEGRIGNVQRLVDADTIDADYLPWLASWTGAVIEPDWEPDRKRLFVRYAARMFTRRGTRRGLLEAIRLATHPCPTEAIFDETAGSDPFGVRVIERFRTRAVAGVVFGDPNDVSGPRYSTSAARWTPADGGSQLHARWRAFLDDRGVTGPSSFPVLTPTDATLALWNEFVRGELAMPYARVGSTDVGRWRQFLSQRYRRFDDYRLAWQVSGTTTATSAASWATVSLPTTLPGDGAPLQDWTTFVSMVLPTDRAAHRATVLVPIRFDDSDEERRQRLGRVRRVVDVERPAHTMVDVAPYWAAFRVGEARVGFETIVGEGGRYLDLVLGAGRLAGSVIPGGGAWRIAERFVSDRDRVGRSVVPVNSGGST